MKKSLLLSTALGVLLLVLLSGCMMQPPLKDTETIAIYKFDAQGQFKMIIETSGTLTDAASQWEDCDSKMKGFIDIAITGMQMMSKDLNEEQKQQLEALKKLKDSFKCEFEKNDAKKTGTLKITFNMSEENMKTLARLGGSKTPEAVSNMIKKNDDGTIEVNIGAIDNTGVSANSMGNNKVKEIRIYVEGKLIEMKPANYTKEDGYYAFKDPESLKGKTLYIKYKPWSTGLFSIMGINFSLEMLAIIGGGIILLVIIIAIILLKRKKKKKVELSPVPQKQFQQQKPVQVQGTNAQQPYSQAQPKAQKPPQAPIPRQEGVAQKTGAQPSSIVQGKAQEPNWESIVQGSSQVKPKQPASQQGQGMQQPSQEQPLQHNAMQSAQQPAQTQAGSDEAKIERLVKLLRPKRFEYTEKEIKSVMIEEGYPEKIANEVIRRLNL